MLCGGPHPQAYIYIQNGMLKLGLDTITKCDKNKKKREGC